jgi:DNA-binding Lrp family transcriptional regulator
MKTGFVLIKSEPGQEYWVLSRLENEPNIKEVYPIFGEYDFLIKIIYEDLNTLGNIVFQKIRVIRGVIDTITLTEAKINRK